MVGLGAKDDVIASCRILGFEYRPFDFERLLRLNPWESERAVGLIGRYCMSKDHRSAAANLHLQVQFLELAAQVAEELGCRELAMYTFPPLVPFYKRASFEPVEPTFFHPGYKRQMVLMRMQLRFPSRQRTLTGAAALTPANSPRGE